VRCGRQEYMALSSAVKTEAEFLSRLALIMFRMEYANPVYFPILSHECNILCDLGIQL